MAASALKQLSEVRVFSGFLRRFEHTSAVLGNLPMKFAVFVPEQSDAKIPTIYYLSGLTCTDENFSQKCTTGFRYAGELGIAIVLPDTSPRGEGVPNDDGYDMGQGAGFYLNATKDPWKQHFHMYDYVVRELPELLQAEFPWYDASRVSITGHSMGGHGAITIGLKNPDAYKSISAFAPIVNPTVVPWGTKAFAGYLSNPETEAREYDACELLRAGKRHKVALKVDQGTKDNFYCGDVNQLQTETLKKVCDETGQPLELAFREGFDHSYYFMSSFIEEHIRFHAKYLLS